MGWVCLQVTGWHACPGPTLLSHRRIHRWHGCDRTACRAHRLRSACGRISLQSRSCRCQEGRRRRCQSCYHTFRKRTDMLKEKEKGHSGLGDKLSNGRWVTEEVPHPQPPSPHSCQDRPGGRAWEDSGSISVPGPGQLSERRARPLHCCVCVRGSGRVGCDGRKRPRSSIFTYFLLESLV